MLKITAYKPIYSSNIKLNNVSRQQNSFKGKGLSDYPLDSYISSTIANSNQIINDKIKTIKASKEIINEVESLINHSSLIRAEVYDYIKKTDSPKEDYNKPLIQVLNDGTIRKVEFLAPNSKIHRIIEKSKDTRKEYTFNYIDKLDSYYESTTPNDNETIEKTLDFNNGKIYSYKVVHKSNLFSDEYDLEDNKTFIFNTENNKLKGYQESTYKKSSKYESQKTINL